LGLWAIAFFSSSAFLLLNLIVAKKLSNSTPSPKKQPQRGGNSVLKLRFLLPIVLGLSALLGLVLIYYGQEVLNIWHPNLKLPPLLGLQEISIPIVQSGLLLGLIFLILINPLFFLKAIAVSISLLLGFVLSAHWIEILQYFHQSSFNYKEPLFNQDISFYIFSLPIWDLIDLGLFGVFLSGTASVGLIYLRSKDSLSQGQFEGFSLPQQLHLNANGSLLMLAIAWRYWLLRYSLLYSTYGVNYGASYTEINVQLPIYTGLSFLAVAIAVYLLLRIIILSRLLKGLKTRKSSIANSGVTIAFPRHLIYLLGLYIVLAGISGEILPNCVQHFIVQPNELARERPYIERTIALTRQAFNLDRIEAQTFDPRGQLSVAVLQENDLTIRNIRLWDTGPLLETNRQLQQIRPYYQFLGADIDRYTLMKEGKGFGNLNSNTPTVAQKQQTIIAARELDYRLVPQQAQTWVNKHLVYTHGYGFTLSPVNTVASGGLPDYYVQDIGVDNTGKKGSLQISSESIRGSIPIGQPRIYYGEITNNYVMTGTKTPELDYPSGNDNVYNVYDGRGGIPIGGGWKRLVTAQYLKDWQMLLTRNFTPQTKLLFRRNIKERVQAIAPFLSYDSDPYLVSADGGATTSKGEKTYLYWIIDAYTTSKAYPSSDPGSNKFNYIRNSVKVIIDAYNGSVNFYVADPTDPIITTFSLIFPTLFKPLDAIPATLHSHLRYPVDLFKIQSERSLAYHMTDPQVFYNREDLWQIPTEIYGSKPRAVEPYYLIMKLPTADTEEFILLLPFTPTQRTNLIAWLAARSDGDQYGKLLLYEFPKQQLVYGQEQIEALINQDPAISQQISLWNRAGSRVIQGNLLVIPIEESLLYVEPLYLEAEQNSLPTLVRVIVVYNNRIVMAETLEQALTAIFEPKTPAEPAIVRPVQ
jgi:uncharacterized protein